MTNIKKLSDYTVSDIEKILKEDLLNYEVLQIWNEIHEHNYPFEYIMHPKDIIDTFNATAVDTSFNVNDNYCYVSQSDIIVSFNNLSDDESPIDYSEMAKLIFEDQVILERFLLKFDITWVED